MTQVRYLKSLRWILSDLEKFAKQLLWSLRPGWDGRSVGRSVGLSTRTDERTDGRTDGRRRELPDIVVDGIHAASLPFASAALAAAVGEREGRLLPRGDEFADGQTNRRRWPRGRAVVKRKKRGSLDTRGLHKYFLTFYVLPITLLPDSDQAPPETNVLLQRAALGLSQGFVISFLESSTGLRAMRQLLCCQAREKLQEELLKRNIQNLHDRPSAAVCIAVGSVDGQRASCSA